MSGEREMLAIHAAMDARERPAVQALGEAIGYGRLMQLAEQIWEEKMPGAAHTTGACSFFMVPCPHPERDDNGHCEWCCGANRVTKHVAKLAGIREILAGWDIGSLPNDYSFLKLAQERMDDLEREMVKVSTLTARVKALEETLGRYVNCYPAFRMKPVGADGSPKRIEQENLTALEDSARALLTQGEKG